MLSSDKFLSLLKIMHLVLSLWRWIDSLLSRNQSHTFSNSLFNRFLICVTSLCWLKILLLSAVRYAWVFDRACRLSFIYHKSNRVLNMDPWGNSEVYGPCFRKDSVCWNEKSSICEIRVKPFNCFSWKTYALHFV